MLVPIDPKSGIPIYIQLKEGLRSAILKGMYPPDSQLPTVRQVAVELSVNANTVARAYMELEKEGIISTQQGRGTFVCAFPEPLHKVEREKQLELLLENLLHEALALGFIAQEVVTKLAAKVKKDFDTDNAERRKP